MFNRKLDSETVMKSNGHRYLIHLGALIIRNTPTVTLYCKHPLIRYVIYFPIDYFFSVEAFGSGSILPWKNIFEMVCVWLLEWVSNQRLLDCGK